MKYFSIQLRRVLRFLPLVLCAVAVLFSSMAMIYRSITAAMTDSEATTKFKIAIVGQSGDTYLEMGIKALETFDSSRYAVEILRMDEQSARQALERGDISTYVVIPEGFVDAALRGEVLTLKYVSTSGAMGLVSMFKDEITQVIEDIVVACQKGMYGVTDALADNEMESQTGQFVHDITLRYVELVLFRSKSYSVEELGIGDALGLEGYLVSGLTVCLLFLAALPFAVLYIKKDMSMERVLCSKRHCAAGLALSELLALTIGILTVCLIAVAALSLFFKQIAAIEMLIRTIPVVLLISCLSYLLFSLVSDLISGVLLYFFGCLALCFISGCLYPVFFFPESVQRFAAYLPTSYARLCVSGCISGADTSVQVWCTLVYSLIFAVIAVYVRTYRIKRIRG